ncbi:MAG: hypothetical protein K6F59_01765 [Gammaproteobacteria bacterium]|nr:hypothetical protein [Gammaproteobacteria bacterium]
MAENYNTDNENLAPYVVKGLSREYAKKVTIAKIIGAIVGGIALLFVSLFFVSNVIAKSSKLVIRAAQGGGSLSLAEKIEDFEAGEGRTTLYAKSLDKIRDIDGNNAVPEDVYMQDGGSHNTQDYFCYTFYLKNVGTSYLHSTMTMTLTLNTKNIADAIRIEVYETQLWTKEQETTFIKYAKRAADGSDEPISYDINKGKCTSFLDNNYISKKGVEAPVGGIVKFTIVMYLEGPDPECVNDILGGTFGFNIDFTNKIQ